MKSLQAIVLWVLIFTFPVLSAAQAQPPGRTAPAPQIKTSPGTPQMKAAAQEAASRWLAMVDTGKYAESWDAASPMFQESIEKAQWQKAMQVNRTPYGNSVSRTLTSAQYAMELPGAPDGKYYLLEYKSSFSHKKSAIEKLTLSQGQDGQWTVSGYYIN